MYTNHTMEKCPKCKEWYMIEQHDDECVVAEHLACPPCRAKQALNNVKKKITDELIQNVFRKYSDNKTIDPNLSE